MKQLKSWVSSHPLIVLTIALAVGLGGIFFLHLGDGYWEMAAQRLILSVIMIGIIILSGGSYVLRVKGGEIGFSLRKCAYVLIIALVAGALTLLANIMLVISGEGALASDWVMLLIAALICCLFVGIFEESLFRGIVFDGFLARMGSARKGVLWAMVLSSLIFGAVHFISFFFTGEAMTASAALQMVLKTVQTGMVGFILAAVYYKTRNLWGVALVHGLNDFLMVGPGAIMGETISVVYVTTGELAGMRIIVYLVFIVLSIPFIVTAWKIVKKADPGTKSIFKPKA